MPGTAEGRRPSMRTLRSGSLLSATFLGLWMLGLQAAPPAEPQAPAQVDDGHAPIQLTLDDVKQRILSNNKLLELAAANVKSKGYATRAMQANYFPQIVGQSVFVHFDDDLGTV